MLTVGAAFFFSMAKSVVISGIGLVTPLGGSARDTWRNLLLGKSISTHSRAELPIAAGRCRITELCTRVAWEAITDAGWADAANAAIIVGTSKGPIESWIESLNDLHDGKPMMHREDGINLSDVATRVAEKIGAPQAPRMTFSAACASGLHAVIRAIMMLRGGEISRAVVIAGESSLHPLFIASFARLGVIAPAGTPCRPFDETRKGFVISEAAAAVCLELKSPAAGDVVIDRFSFGGDATHLTGSDLEAKTLRRMLKTVCAGRPIDLIHAHGTATASNDPIELAAIESAITAGAPPVLYSHKGALGHSLGAAGLVSLAINALAHRAGVVPGNIYTHKPIPATRVQLSPKAIKRPIRSSIILASGFGGSLGALGLTII
jgi:3-oxoacyl-[acyl-carrier-protein] synthase II